MTDVRVEGQASKRGLIPRFPAPDRLIADARTWIEAEYGPVVRAAHEASQGSCAELRLDLHPAADALAITVDETGRVTAGADTGDAGPGYHTFVCRILDRLGDELDILWVPTHDPSAIGAPAAWVGSRPPLADRAVAERDHLAMLLRAVERAGAQRRRGIDHVQLGLKPDTRFEFDEAVATPLGPRDDAWLARAAVEPAAGIESRPWWFDVMDERYLLARALVILWTEVRWRPPADDAERAVMDEALTLLRKAIRSAPSLAYPWREWAELITLRSVPDPIADRVFREAHRMDAGLPRIGYRRRPVVVVHEGWQLPVPGSFSGQRTDEEWRGGEGSRHVTVAATVTETANGAPMSADEFLTTVAGDLGEGMLVNDAGELRGRARLTIDTGSGLEVAVLEGFAAVTGSGAAIRVEFGSSDDWQWAMDLWRSLRPA